MYKIVIVDAVDVCPSAFRAIKEHGRTWIINKSGGFEGLSAFHYIFLLVHILHRPTTVPKWTYCLTI